MTQEEKELLLLKDLCCRLPFGVKLKHIPSGEDTVLGMIGCGVIDGDIHDVIENFRPYLRPISSMTGDEAEEYHTIDTGFIRGDMTAKIDFYLKHHFDFRLTSEGLSMIEAGLALEAPTNMYNSKGE